MKLIFNNLLWITVIFVVCCPVSSKAYSVLTHEAIVDASWESSILPLLKNKYPGSTEEQLKQARAFAYGGAIAPDMGYFAFGSHLFTDLVHYVRSGDFIHALLDEAREVNEYAFALGFLCHYMSDKYGHSIAINKCVPIAYPKLKNKFGDVVVYEKDHTSHRRVEFAFDVLQTARGNYASRSYHGFIGFEVSRPVLERAFSKTYGLDINGVFGNLSLAIGTFRWSVKNLFPAMTRAAWVIKKNEIRKLQPTATSRSFNYRMSRASYYREFGKEHSRPGFFANAFSWVIRILPKVGTLRSLKIKEPGPAEEKLFIQSFDTVVLNCAAAMKNLNTQSIRFANINYDTGDDTAPGDYELADNNYGKLLLKLSEQKFDLLSPALKENIIAFYGNSNAAIAAKNNLEEWGKTMKALEELKLVQVK
ncbi:MAG TPA: zinc dependent phospholipase C family protein [Ferruginibacter sp.]|nr:zinc dependent phospholipase C family protein [Ferruginibacter sp.]